MTFQRHPLAAWAFTIAMRISNGLMRLPNRIMPAPFRLMQIGSLFWQSRALSVAARLDLATVIGDRALASADLAAEIGAHPRSLHRLLRMLVAMGIFEEIKPGIYRNNPLSTPLRSDQPQSVRAIIMMHNSPEMSRPWYEQLEPGIRAGEVPFELAHGVGLYDFMDQHPDFDALFADAMDRVEALAGDSFATQFDWGRFGRVIDLGGSKGSKSVAILKCHPHLQAVVVDRALTIKDAPAYWAERPGAECLSRMRFEAGDILTSIPAATDSRDIYLLSAVLHGFDDDRCVKALTTVATAVSTTGATVVLLELVMPDFRADLTAASFDMQMFMGTRGGERTREDWDRVFRRSGMELIETVHLASFGKMLVLRPNTD